MSDRSYIDQQDFQTATINCEAATESLQRARLLNTPSAIYRPEIFQDGNAWCALLGADIAVGVTGWGETPSAAMAAFDVAWHTKAGTGNPASSSEIGSVPSAAPKDTHTSVTQKNAGPQ